jgi:hypothetical protein
MQEGSKHHGNWHMATRLFGREEICSERVKGLLRRWSVVHSADRPFGHVHRLSIDVTAQDATAEGCRKFSTDTVAAWISQQLPAESNRNGGMPVAKQGMHVCQ